MIQIDMLMEALRRQNIPVITNKDRIYVEIGEKDACEKISRAMELRNAGNTVIMTR